MQFVWKFLDAGCWFKGERGQNETYGFLGKSCAPQKSFRYCDGTELSSRELGKQIFNQSLRDLDFLCCEDLLRERSGVQWDSFDGGERRIKEGEGGTAVFLSV